MKDGRLAPFCYQSLDATAVIRERFTGQERAIALAIYSSLTWAANEERKRDDFELPRAELADLAGVSQRTLDRYVKELEEVGLVRRSGGKKTGRPNAWTLLEPGQEGGVSESHPPVVSVSPGATQTHQEVSQSDTTPYIEEEENEENEETPHDPLLVEDFEAWLSHHWATTGMAPPREGTKARANTFSMYQARHAEGYRTEELQLAIDGAWADDYRRSQGYFDHQSVLRPTKIHKLIEAGRRARASAKEASPGGTREHWVAWVARELPDLDDYMASRAVFAAQAFAAGGYDVTPELVRSRLGLDAEAA